MARTLSLCVVVLALGFFAGGLQGQGKDKQTPPLPKDHKDVVGTVKNTDLKKNTFTIVMEEVKNPERTFLVTKDTKFIGPRGGASDEGLKDDRMDAGYDVRV